MKILLISDLHSNLPALDAVLKDAEKIGFDRIWNLGDFIGHSPYPEEVVQKMKELKCINLVGNYDLKVLDFPSQEEKWKEEKTPAKFFSLEWTYRQLSKSSAAFLLQLPHQQTISMGRIKFLLVHGSPDGLEDPLEVDTPESRFLELAGKVKKHNIQVVLCGHTHKFFHKEIGGIQWINPGSVGRPFDGDPRASYCMLTVESGKLEVKNRRVEYDLKENLKAMKHFGFPQLLIRAISLGRDPDELEQPPKSNNKILVESATDLAEKCKYEKVHTQHVTKLTLKLFDELKSLHKLDNEDRQILEAASLLHDIGWVKGGKGHHKTSRDIILDSNLPLDKKEKTVVALVARYHRKNMPDDKKHKYYANLEPVQKARIRSLASLLRVGDGLDAMHLSSVKNLTCTIDAKRVIIQIDSEDFSDVEKEAALKKSDLFRSTFDKKAVIQWNKDIDKKGKEDEE